VRALLDSVLADGLGGAGEMHQVKLGRRLWTAKEKRALEMLQMLLQSKITITLKYNIQSKY
jgi:hypothetical protein